MNNINKKTSYLKNPVAGLPTPEQVSETVSSFGKTASTAGLNKLSGLTGFVKNNSGVISGAANLATGLVTSLTPQAEDKGSQIGGQVLNGLGDVASMIPGIGTAIGVGLKGLSALVTSVGPKVKGNTAKELTDTSASYGGLDKLDSKKFGLFGIEAGKRYAKKVAEREQQRYKSEDILQTSKLNQEAAAGSIQNMANKYNLEKMGGWQQTNGIRFGKSGTKVDYDLSFAHKVLNHLKEESPEKFENGGKMNVIPDGALHAHKHNIEDSSLDGKVTKKGIPVVCKDGSSIEQVAEIERNEIIFTKEVTDKLEELRDLGTPEAAIEAGKLLVQEILYNTKDNTGLLNQVE